MTGKATGVLGAVTLLAGAGVAQATPPAQASVAAFMNAKTYAELLQPVPNAAELLKSSDEELRAAPLPLAREGDRQVETAQFYHHHHHHHHGYFRGPFFHHHHHGFYRHFYRRHHHHHHHHFYRDGDY